MPDENVNKRTSKQTNKQKQINKKTKHNKQGGSDVLISVSVVSDSTNNNSTFTSVMHPAG